MNEARARLIDVETRAPALIEPLTELVIRAGAAILAVNRSAHEGRRQARRIAGDGSRSRRRPHHRRRPGAARAANIRRCPKSASIWRRRHIRDSFFLIDPLDGTKEFVAGRNEFTVNLALVTEGKPLLGIVGAPALGLVWRGLVGRGAERLTRCEYVRSGPSSRSAPAPARPPDNPGRWRSAARMAMPGPKPLSTAAGRGPGEARLGGQIRPGRGGRSRYLSPPRPHLRMGRRGRTCGGHRGRRQGDGLGRAPSCISAWGGRISSCRNSSPGAIRRRRQFECYCASPCCSSGQRASASFKNRAGSAAKAARCSSRPNR